VSFIEDERLIILRLSKPEGRQAASPIKAMDWRQWAGVLTR
jgi:hypothetical protein